MASIFIHNIITAAESSGLNLRCFFNVFKIEFTINLTMRKRANVNTFQSVLLATKNV